MSKRQRPLSPHLGIYRMPLTAGLQSVFHRATGVALVFGLIVLVYWLMAAAAGPEAYKSAQALLGSGFGMFLLFGWSFSLFYHLCNGIRHLYWDAGKGFDLEASDTSGKFVLAMTGLLTLITWVAVYLSQGGGQ
ncbi:MAG: succinate dehydrogenase, cytochrome b556 subunit [Pseudomonadota bacterium]